ncbi:MAG: sensor histidine kinase [Granulosicoccus sp.]
MSLYIRLSLVFLVTLLILGVFSLWIAERSARNYFLEFTQRLNAPIAMYMAENAGLVVDGALDHQALNSLAEHVMMVNPSVEVYVLDLQGFVMAQAASANVIAQPRVSMQPIREAIRLNTPSTVVLNDNPTLSDTEPVNEAAENQFSGTLLGDNPLDPNDQRPFSVHPLQADGKTIGYIYALLAGREHQTLLSAIRSSHTLRDLVWILSGVLVLAGVAGSVVFFSLTRRLRGLTRHVQAASTATQLLGPGSNLPIKTRQQRLFSTYDEIDELTAAYDNMAIKLQSQYQSLEKKDRIRRELIANISHDLRTPLTTLQGYLETVILKRGSLNESVEHRYLAIAHKNCKRLRRLVSELFELSKLDSEEYELDSEVFSLLELAHDALQDLTPQAEKRKITLTVNNRTRDDEPIDVNADIALVHRALENLLNNALRHAPSGGNISIDIVRINNERINIAVIDDGDGMAHHDAQLAFEPRFRADTDSASKNDDEEFGHAGLGLAIVKSIVKLHGCDISLETKPGCGARFGFSLPAAA